MSRLTSTRNTSGFTLVETLAALVVFTIVTLGVIPLLTASLRGTNLARSSNVAKSLAVRAMERIRGLPYYVAYETQPPLAGGPARIDLDVLDIYHPTATNPTTIVCPTAGGPACPTDIPTGYRVTFVTTFVGSDGSTPVGTAGYNSNAETVDAPPSSLLRTTVNVTWSVRGRARSYQLNTLVGDRAFGRLKTKGVAKVDYGIRAGTSFRGTQADGSLLRTDLTAIGGTSDSRTETRTNAAADQSVRAAQISLVNGETGASLAESFGAIKDVHAPPNSDEPDLAALGGTINAVDVGDVAGLDSSQTGKPDLVGDVSVAVQSELPRAKGGFSFLDSASALLDFWVDNPQADRDTDPDDSADTLHLRPGEKILSIPMVDSATDPDPNLGTLLGYSNSATTSTGVLSTGHVEIESVRVLPTNFIFSQDPTYGGAVIAIDEFVADVSCQAFRTSAAGPASASVTWSASLYYWKDTDPTDNKQIGSYQRVDLSGAVGTDLLATLTGAGNPLVYEEPDDSDPTTIEEEKDIYLFPTVTNPGYLQSWSSRVNVASGVDISADGRSTSAALDGALRIDTVPLPADSQRFPMNLTIGALSCESVDFR